MHFVSNIACPFCVKQVKFQCKVDNKISSDNVAANPVALESTRTEAECTLSNQDIFCCVLEFLCPEALCLCQFLSKETNQ